MSSKIADGVLRINNLTVRGEIIFVENQEAFNNIEGIETFDKISGEFDNLTIEGDFIVPEFPTFNNTVMPDVIISGTVISTSNKRLQ